MSELRILIIGAGPTGLGAAWRLEDLGHADWMLLEESEQAGGLAGSVVDRQGFTWDFGCHVLYSHYSYVDALVERALACGWLQHEREAWVWIRGHWVPYPLQNNLWRLPPDEALRCLDGLLAARLECRSEVSTFEDWLRASFGDGLFEIFLGPYNRKVWAYPPAQMDVGWMSERIAPVDVRRVVHNMVLRRDDSGWGPNARFRFPLRGGTGAIWQSLCAQLPPHRVRLRCRVTSVDVSRRTVTVESGEEIKFDALISTMPLYRLLTRLRGASALVAQAERLVHSACHIVGLGFEGAVPAEIRTKSWIYFPEPVFPFHRATVFSNYSPHNVPRPGAQWSLLAEVSESSYKPVDVRTVVDDTLEGFRRCGLVGEETRVATRWHRRLEYGYPTPWLGRDAVLDSINHDLEQWGIFSRGRFGAWKYEVSNQDHSVMQGVEVIERLLRGGTEYTFHGDVHDWLPTSVTARYEARS